MSDSGPFRLGASASKKGFTVAVRSDLYCPPRAPVKKVLAGEAWFTVKSPDFLLYRPLTHRGSGAKQRADRRTATRLPELAAAKRRSSKKLLMADGRKRPQFWQGPPTAKPRCGERM